MKRNSPSCCCSIIVIRANGRRMWVKKAPDRARYLREREGKTGEVVRGKSGEGRGGEDVERGEVTEANGKRDMGKN